MKKIFLTLSTTLLCATGFFACSQPEQTPKPDSNVAQTHAVPAVLHGATLDGVAIPDGTRTSVEDGGKTVRLLYPAGIQFVTSLQYRADLAAKMIDGGSTYTCTGACSSGCDVFYVQGSFACSQCSNGSACTGKASRAIATGGFIDVKAGISFIRNKAQLKELRTKNIQSPDDLFKFEYVKRAMRELNIKVHGVADPTKMIAQNPTEYRHVAINVFGALVDYAVPLKYLDSETNRLSPRKTSIGVQSETTAEPSQHFVRADEESGFSCNCSSGGSGCTAESGLGYKKCNSGSCVSCSMTVG